MIETMTMYFTVILPNTMISFWNISTASAPIQNTAARVKYWINSDMMVQPTSVSVRSSPTRTKSSMKNMAILSCVWNLLASRTRSFLNKSATYSHANGSKFLCYWLWSSSPECNHCDDGEYQSYHWDNGTCNGKSSQGLVKLTSFTSSIDILQNRIEFL